MIIDRNSAQPLGPTERTRETKRVSSSKPASVSSGGASQSDDVTISSTASQASSLLSADQNQRAEKVDKLTLEVQSGQYKVDSAAVSKALVDQALQATSMDRGLPLGPQCLGHGPWGFGRRLTDSSPFGLI